MSSHGRESPGFEDLYEAHWRLVIAIGMSILRDPQLAEDAAQETWIRIARTLGRGESPRRPGAWVARFARNEALRLAGRGSGPVKFVPDPVTPVEGDDPEEFEDLDLLRRALDRLDADDRHLLTRRYLEGCTPGALGKELSLSRTGVWKKLKAALARLRKAIRAGESQSEREAGG